MAFFDHSMVQDMTGKICSRIFIISDLSSTASFVLTVNARCPILDEIAVEVYQIGIITLILNHMQALSTQFSLENGACMDKHSSLEAHRTHQKILL